MINSVPCIKAQDRLFRRLSVDSNLQDGYIYESCKSVMKRIDNHLYHFRKR